MTITMTTGNVSLVCSSLAFARTRMMKNDRDELLLRVMAEARRTGTCAYRMQADDNGIVQTCFIPASQLWPDRERADVMYEAQA